ncbi:hypothetical protein K413DRAFT_4709 [Clostridium sp. ASBs410]|nr:hypothetical protein K413DRAFT_4709 [Clostridium sp. ASBs410]
MKNLINYVPKKYQHLISDLYREDKHICIVMKWKDGFSRSRVADNISEMKEIIQELVKDRNSYF